MQNLGCLVGKRLRASTFNATVGTLSPANRGRQLTVASREMYPGPEARRFLRLRRTRLADKNRFGSAYDIDDKYHRYFADTVHPTLGDLISVPVYYTVLCGFPDLTERTLATHPQDLKAQGGVCGAQLNAGNVRPSIWNNHRCREAPRNKSGKTNPGATLLPDRCKTRICQYGECCIIAEIRLCRCSSCADNSQSPGAVATQTQCIATFGTHATGSPNLSSSSTSISAT